MRVLKFVTVPYVAILTTVSIIEHNRKESNHNRGSFWEILESSLGKFLSIISAKA